ncbi:MAG TPA: HAD family phosphatase [Bryobacteraceae bacterium]|jgi:putative hydrolase of the HAD superfamily|nr:HAD family phosphatase [Bryobacteraceae bacterium]
MALVNDFDSIIFDYGGVLATHQTDADLAKLARLLGVTTDQFSELYWANRAEYDRGALTAAEYWMDMLRHSQKNMDAALVDKLTDLDSASWMHFDEPMWDWIDHLRLAKKRIAVLSNMPRELGEALKTKTDRLGAFDHVTLSFEVHSVKPEPAIYEHCLTGLGTTPERTLFFDDRIENVQGAELLGIRAIQFLDRDEVLEKLR